MLTLLFDGMNYIRRLAEALSREDQMATPVEVMKSTEALIRSALDRFKPGNYFVVLEGDTEEHPSWRKVLYPKYQSDRVPPPPEMARLLKDIVALASKAWPILSEVGQDADDTIGLKSTSLVLEGHTVIVCSADKDMLGLLRPGLRVWHPFDAKWLNEAYVQKRFGIRPDQFYEWQALTGDRVDGIPGVRSIGPKTATALLSSYSGLDDIYAHLEDIAPRVRKLLESSKTEAYLSLDLARLRQTKARSTEAQLDLF